MANRKTSEFPTITSINDASFLTVLQSGVNTIITWSNIKTLLAAVAWTFSGVITFSQNPKTDGISENTSAAGVTIDSVLCKDGTIRVPGSAGYAPTTNGDFGYDSTSHTYDVRVNGTNQYLIHDGNVVANALPSQGSNNGKFLKTDGTNASWATLPITLSYTSSQQTITSNTTTTLAHSLGAAPKLVQVDLVCQTAEQGWSIGDVINNVCYNQAAKGPVVYSDATNVYVILSTDAAVFVGLHKTNRTQTNLTNANWKFVVKAFA